MIDLLPKKKKYLNTIRYELLHKYGYIYILYGLSLYNIIEEHMKKKEMRKNTNKLKPNLISFFHTESLPFV